MNMAYNSYQDQEMEYQNENERGGKDKAGRPRRQTYGRGKKGPVAYNGIHRRRNKRFSW